MANKLKEPHILLASSNPYRLIKNIRPHLTRKSITNLESAVKDNCRSLFALGHEHHLFAKALPTTQWRQRASRFYYGAYNMRRAASLIDSGAYSTDSSDHANVDVLPALFPQRPLHAGRLKILRDDRNLADYNHTATPADLLLTTAQAEAAADQFLTDTKTYLATKGLII